MGLRMAVFICLSFEFSKRIPDEASIFTAELSVLRYIKSTTNRYKLVVLVT